MKNKINTKFPVTIYGNFEKHNEVISKARCRIFYKYGNRNATYITDEFAEKLINTLPYTPVKGIYSIKEEDNVYGKTGDYEGHGTSRSLGRIYGVVPENFNFAWETHLDEDGVEREYACADVLIYTGLYEEAEEITRKGLSMELYEGSIKGDWQNIGDQKVFVFEEGRFLGLQVLGDETEPCFEGAAFYSLYTSFQELIKEIKEYNMNFQNERGGQKVMSKIKFKLSDSQKLEAIWSLLNTDKTEEGESYVEYAITDVYENYALVYKYETGEFARVCYTKNEETDSIELGDIEERHVFDLTEDEKNVLEAIKEKNEGTFEKADEVFDKYSALEAEKVTFEERIEALEKEVEVLKAEKETYTSEQEAEKLEKENLKEQVEALESYKLKVETEEKEAVIAEYEEKLSEEILNSYKEKIAEYTSLELEKDLAYLYVKSGSPNFEKDALFVDEDEPLTGIEALLSKYR